MKTRYEVTLQRKVIIYDENKAMAVTKALSFHKHQNMKFVSVEELPPVEEEGKGLSVGIVDVSPALQRVRK
jgi:hypothetical protein